MVKPIILHGHQSGPNPWKVAIILQELGLAYEYKFWELSALKQEPYVSLNPNGRVPTIEDPNTGLVIWESGAIIQYLVEQYDKDAKLHYDSLAERSLERSWLHFQMSGQGPYYGQKGWFSAFHPEKIPSAIERYEKEIRRVLGVIDSYLAQKKTDYLVGNKVSHADLAFVTWDTMLPWLLGADFDFKKEFPHAGAWHERLISRPAVKKVLEDQVKAKAAAAAKK